MTDKTYRYLIWSTFPGSAAHPWDYANLADRPLQRPDGAPVELTRSGMDYVVKIDGKEVLRTRDGLIVCQYMNQAEVGLSV